MNIQPRIVLLTTVLSALSGIASAQSTTPAPGVSEGAALGDALSKKPVLPTYSNGGAKAAGVVTLPGAGQVNITDLVPGADGAAVEHLKAVARDPNHLTQAGQAEMQRQSQDTSRAAAAYRTMVNAGRVSPQAMQALQSSPLAASTLSALTQAKAGKYDHDFADCKTETTLEPVPNAGADLVTVETCETDAANPGRIAGEGCRVLARRPACEEVSTECLDSPRAADGSCVVASHTYECKARVRTHDMRAVVKNNCDGGGSGMLPTGTDTIHTEDQQGISIVEAQARILVSQHVHSDISWSTTPAATISPVAQLGPRGVTSGATRTIFAGDPGDPIDPPSDGGGTTPAPTPAPAPDPDDDAAASGPVSPNLQVFKGTARQCTKTLGSTLNCCASTHTEAPQVWWSLYSQHVRQSQANQALSEDGESTGGWAQMKGGATMASVSSTFTSTSENVHGGGNGSVGNANTGIGSGGNLATVHSAFLQTAQQEIQPKLGWYCSQEEFDLAVEKETGSTQYLGSYCSKRVLGVCVQKKESYIAYSSPVSKDIRVYLAGGPAAVARGALGKPRRPNPAGVPLAALANVDLGKMMVDGIVARMAQGGATPNTVSNTADNSARLTGGGSAMHDSTRQTAQARTNGRVANVDATAAYRSITADAMRGVPGSASVASNATAQVSFAPAYRQLRRGQQSALIIDRTAGGQSSSAVVDLVSVNGIRSTDVRFQRMRVSWPAGDTSPRSVAIATLPGTGTGRLVFQLSQISGAIAGPAVQATVDVE